MLDKLPRRRVPAPGRFRYPTIGMLDKLLDLGLRIVCWFRYPTIGMLDKLGHVQASVWKGAVLKKARSALADRAYFLSASVQETHVSSRTVYR